jgi:hypothetical protein
MFSHGPSKIYIFLDNRFIKLIFFITVVNSLKVHRGAIVVYMKYTRELLKYRKRIAKFQKLKKVRNRQTIPFFSPCLKGL